jgi:hypothetical protein
MSHEVATTPDENGYVGRSFLQRRYRVTGKTIDRWMKRKAPPVFPKPVRFNEGQFARRFWRLADVLEFEKQLLAKRAER